MKAEIRKQLKERRNVLLTDFVMKNSTKMAEILFKTVVYKNSECIMLYKALGNEVNTDAIFEKGLADGKTLVFPVTDSKSGVIVPYSADRNTVFNKGGFSVEEPQNSHEIQAGEIDLVIVPGIGFDMKGNRIGFGKGCYDGFLKECNAVKIGLCYGFQVVENIPAEEHDIKMDYILTEKGFFSCI